MLVDAPLEGGPEVLVPDAGEGRQPVGEFARREEGFDAASSACRPAAAGADADRAFAAAAVGELGLVSVLFAEVTEPTLRAPPARGPALYPPYDA
ncbi:hypothetical protein O1L55_27705 [Streptomyces albulus]|nr:hypothetical protein [Streptomyces noursei]